MGLVTPLILYGRVIFSRYGRALLWSVFYRAQVFVLLFLGVSPDVMLLIQYGLYHLPQDPKTFPLARVASIHQCIETLLCHVRIARLSLREIAPSSSKKNSGLVNPRWRIYIDFVRKDSIEWTAISIDGT